MDYKLIGAPCGEHGPYTFYKGFKYTKNGQTNVLSLSEFFFVKLWTDSDLISIGELQLLWEDKNSEQTLASLRLYILPENTPDGRTDIHGEDEVLAITEKVVIRIEDLLTWITNATDWHWGLGAVWEKDCARLSNEVQQASPYQIAIDLEDIKKEKEQLDKSHWEKMTGVIVLSYPRYCRYRGILKRLEGVHDKWLRTNLVVALGGITGPCKNTRVLFCKDTFDYPELEGHELLCNHLAPKLKGRPRKRKRFTVTVGEEVEDEEEEEEEEGGSESESESSQSTGSSTSKSRTQTRPNLVKPRLRCTLEVKAQPPKGPTAEEINFLNNLHCFMKQRNTPISKIPVVGFKEVNLFKLFKKVRELGGYDVVTTGKLWKYVYEVMGGDASSTSATTLSRRHYEKLLLPYERHLNGRAVPRFNSTITLTAISNSKMEENKNVQRALSPLIKKQKLDILKEGGLEVTPVGISRPPPPVIKAAAPPPPPAPIINNFPNAHSNKISITVTPDMSHLLCPPGPSPKSMYGNPKDIQPPSIMNHINSQHHHLIRKNPVVIPEVLDLRTKPKINIGSNLEITLVPSNNKSTPAFKPPVVTPKRRPPPSAPARHSLPAAAPIRAYHPVPPPGANSGFKAPYIPVVDPLYISALYNGMIPRPPYPNSAQPGGSSNPTANHHSLYKEIIRRHSIFPPHLLRDGSTSITLVGQTPSKPQ